MIEIPSITKRGISAGLQNVPLYLIISKALPYLYLLTYSFRKGLKIQKPKILEPK